MLLFYLLKAVLLRNFTGHHLEFFTFILFAFWLDTIIGHLLSKLS